jgi:hypothetical protein
LFIFSSKKKIEVGGPQPQKMAEFYNCKIGLRGSTALPLRKCKRLHGNAAWSKGFHLMAGKINPGINPEKRLNSFFFFKSPLLRNGFPARFGAGFSFFLSQSARCGQVQS